jgi:hypothetical protein
VFGICESRLAFLTDFLGVLLKVASTCHSYEDGHRFSSYKCISGLTTSLRMLKEVDPYETVFWPLKL